MSKKTTSALLALVIGFFTACAPDFTDACAAQCQAPSSPTACTTDDEETCQTDCLQATDGLSQCRGDCVLDAAGELEETGDMCIQPLWETVTATTCMGLCTG